jgi:hypothetical protein
LPAGTVLVDELSFRHEITPAAIIAPIRIVIKTFLFIFILIMILDEK